MGRVCDREHPGGEVQGQQCPEPQAAAGVGLPAATHPADVPKAVELTAGKLLSVSFKIIFLVDL